MNMGAHVPWCPCGGQETTFSSQVWPASLLKPVPLVSTTVVHVPDWLALELLVIFPVSTSLLTAEAPRLLTWGRHLCLRVGLRASNFTCWDIVSTRECAVSYTIPHSYELNNSAIKLCSLIKFELLLRNEIKILNQNKKNVCTFVEIR